MGNDSNSFVDLFAFNLENFWQDFTDEFLEIFKDEIVEFFSLKIKENLVIDDE